MTAATAACRVLIVEDSESDQALAEAALDAPGFAAVEAVDTLGAALAALSTRGDPYDVVLCDLALPDAFGLDAVQRLHAVAPDAAVVVFTGDSDPETGLNAVRAGAQDFVPKGASPELLRRALIYAAERARASRRVDALKKFVDMISHEYRTPLAIISTACDLCERALADDPPRIDALERNIRRIKQSIRRQVDMIDAVLIASRVEAGKTQLAPRRANVGEIIVAQCENQRAMTAGRADDLSLALELDDPMAIADVDALGYVVANFVNNALKYSDAGAAVEVSAWDAGRRWHLAVRDHGVGVPIDERAKIWDRFHRAANVRTIPGAGVGLDVVKHFVEAHGGGVAVHDPADGGPGAVFSAWFLRDPFSGAS